MFFIALFVSHKDDQSTGGKIQHLPKLIPSKSQMVPEKT